MELKGKSVLVTGGSRGVGAATVPGFDRRVAPGLYAQRVPLLSAAQRRTVEYDGSGQ